MKRDEILELILGTITGILAGFILIQILTINPESNKLSSFFTSLKDIKFYVVSSGSMEPSIKLGSAIVVLPKPVYKEGDVITFKPGGIKGIPVTHRIKVKQPAEEGALYTTAGDANEDLDRGQIKHENIIGSVALSVPFIGFLINLAKYPQGFILLVIIPATIVIYEELKSIRRELSRFLGSFFQKKGLNLSAQSQVIKHRRFFKLFSLVPLLGASLVFAAVSSSFFFDSEQSINNILSAAATFPSTSPSPTPAPDPSRTLVINEVLPDTLCNQGQTEAQWIEVYNKSDITVNLKNFKISDGVNIIDLVTANNIEVTPGGFALLAHNNAIWNHCYPDNGVITANLGGQLNIDSRFLILLDVSGEAVDTVAWGAGTGLEPVINQSIEREPDGFDTAFGTDFEPTDFKIREVPTPGL